MRKLLIDNLTKLNSATRILATKNDYFHPQLNIHKDMTLKEIKSSFNILTGFISHPEFSYLLRYKPYYDKSYDKPYNDKSNDKSKS